MALIQYTSDPARWNNDRKQFYAWRAGQGFDMSGETLCRLLHVTSPILCKYLGQFDYVRLPVEGNGNMKKQVVHFRRKEVEPYLQSAVSCTRRMRWHNVPSMVWQAVQAAKNKTVINDDGEEVPADPSDIAIAQIYLDFGYNERIAWMMTKTGLNQACRKWYKIPSVQCATPIDWHLARLERSGGAQSREMNQRRWAAMAAINISMKSGTSNQELVLHMIKDPPDHAVPVPAVYTDKDLYLEKLPELKDGWQPDLPPVMA